MEEIINKCIAKVLNTTYQLYLEKGLSRVFIQRASETRIENLIEANSIRKFTTMIDNLDDEFKRQHNTSYKEILFSATTQLIYQLTVHGAWETASEAAINAMTNHLSLSPTSAGITEQTSAKSIMANQGSVTLTREALNNERWFIAYGLIVIFLATPENMAGIREYIT